LTEFVYIVTKLTSIRKKKVILVKKDHEIV